MPKAQFTISVLIEHELEYNTGDDLTMLAAKAVDELWAKLEKDHLLVDAEADSVLLHKGISERLF